MNYYNEFDPKAAASLRELIKNKLIPCTDEKAQHVESGTIGWMRVVYSADCDEDGNCPVCGIDFADCGCPGPTQDGYQYEDREDGLWAFWVGDTEQQRKHAKPS